MIGYMLDAKYTGEARAKHRASYAGVGWARGGGAENCPDAGRQTMYY